MADRLELKPFHARNGDYTRLFAFARTALEALVPGLAPPETEISRTRESKDYEVSRTTLRVGDERAGFEITLQEDRVEAGAITLSADIVRVRAYGLPSGTALMIESIRPPNHSVQQRLI